MNLEEWPLLYWPPDPQGGLHVSHVKFHTLKYAKILEEAGFSKKQAETSVQILVEVMEDKLASKQDLLDLRRATREDVAKLWHVTQQDIAELRNEMHQSFAEARSEMHQGFTEVRSEMRQMISKVELTMTLRMGAVVAAGIAILTALQKFVLKV